MKITDIQEIKTKFEVGFHPIDKLFHILELSVEEAPHSAEKYVWHPGVYVWIHPEDGVLRVGRHLTNSRKRALEHIGANTGGIMTERAAKPGTRLLLFNVIDPKDYHWVAALEIFFENELFPEVKAGRKG